MFGSIKSYCCPACCYYRVKVKKRKSEQACKPSSVIESNHLSCGSIADAVMPPVGDSAEQAGPAYAVVPRSVLLRIGFTGRGGSPRAGELLPRLSILTGHARRFLSVALSLRSPSAAVSRYPALWGSDFPHKVAFARLLSLLTNYFTAFFTYCQGFLPVWHQQGARSTDSDLIYCSYVR